MPHMPTLGSAYEEITKQGIDRDFIIPKFLDLRIVSGFIEVANEMLPQQIDCMLVHGAGRKYGLTEQFIYDIDKVLCIFEVKKTLKRNDYLDAFEHLGKIRKKFAAHFEYKLRHDNYEPDITAARKHFSQITGKVAPERYLDIHTLSKPDAILLYTLVQESLAPVSIIHGYEGYKTENGLRTAFLNIIEEKQRNGESGVGVAYIPTLVTSNKFCLIKSNGVPFITVNNNNEWVAIFSTRHNSAKLMLELIWSKISLYFDVKMPWDDNLHMDSGSPLLVAKPFEDKKAAGWKYYAIELKERTLTKNNDNTWKPIKVSKAEISTINLMTTLYGGYLPLDSKMDNFLKKEYGISINEVKKNLIKSRFFMIDNGYIRPISMHTYILTMDDGSGFIAIEEDRFKLWCAEKGIPAFYTIFILME